MLMNRGLMRPVELPGPAHLHRPILGMVEGCPLGVVLPELQELVEEVPGEPPGDGSPVVLHLLHEKRALEVLAAVPELVGEGHDPVAVAGPIDGATVDRIEPLPNDVVVIPGKHPLPVLADLVVDPNVGRRKVPVPGRARRPEDHPSRVMVGLHPGDVGVGSQEVFRVARDSGSWKG